jgi:hypothetical protein
MPLTTPPPLGAVTGPCNPERQDAMRLTHDATDHDRAPFPGPAIPGRIEPEHWPPQTSPSDTGRDPDPLPPRAQRVGDELFFSRPLIGYRAWIIDNDGLVSREDDWRWRPGVNVAHCSRDVSHDAPAPDCSCGLAAVHDPDDVSPWAGQLGLVAARGRVMIHHDGFRAEEMVPLALVIDELDRQPLKRGSNRERQLHEEWRRQLQRVSQRYSIPLCGEGSLERRAARYGQVIHYADLPELPVEPAEPRGRLKRLLGRLAAGG